MKIGKRYLVFASSEMKEQVRVENPLPQTISSESAKKSEFYKLFFTLTFNWWVCLRIVSVFILKTDGETSCDYLPVPFLFGKDTFKNLLRIMF